MRAEHLPGRLVWGKLRGHRYWPAVEVTRSQSYITASARRPIHTWVLWFGDLLLSKVKVTSLEEFAEAFDKRYSKAGPSLYTRAVTQAVREWCIRAGQPECPGQLSSAVKFFKHHRRSATAFSENASPKQVRRVHEGKISKYRHRDYSRLYEHDKVCISSLCSKCSHKGSSKRGTLPGRLVWGKLDGYPHWPGLTVCATWCFVPHAEESHLWIFWFGDHYISKIKRTAVSDLAEDFPRRAAPTEEGSLLQRAVLEALREYSYQRGATEHLNDSPNQLLAWGISTFLDTRVPSCEPFAGGTVSPFVRRHLARLRSLRRSRASSSSSPSPSSSDSDVFVSEAGGDTTDDEAPPGHEWIEKLEQIQQVKAGEVAVESVCIACASVTCTVRGLHPLFQAGCCTPCLEALSVVLVELDHSSMYCVVCAAPGRLLLCDQPHCLMVFCTECIELLVGKTFMERTVGSGAPWSCFLCSTYAPSTHGLLRPRRRWQQSLEHVKRESCLLLPCLQAPEDRTKLPLKPLRVLSLFDGISTGLYCLDRLGVAVEVYFSSEVNEAAMTVSEKHFRGRVVRLGDVSGISDEQIAAISPIDLVIGGSPCSDLSSVNPNRKGLFDPSGTGILFFEFVRVLKSVARTNKQGRLFWLFENVASMPKQYRNAISKHLHCEPVTVDARWFTPMSRARLFWGNIPGLSDFNSNTVEARPRKLGDFVEQVYDRDAGAAQLRCVTTSSGSTTASGSSAQPITMRGRPDNIWITELEKLFGFPAHFTDVGNLSSTQRQALLGKAWSVQVVLCLLEPLESLFQRASGTH